MKHYTLVPEIQSLEEKMFLLELYTQWKFPDLSAPDMPSPDFLQEKLSVAGFNFLVRAFPFLFKEKNQVVAFVMKRVAVYGAPLVPVFSLGMRRLSIESLESDDDFMISGDSSPRSLPVAVQHSDDASFLSADSGDSSMEMLSAPQPPA